MGSQQYLLASTPLVYPISFGNESTASASAQTVVITDPLNTSADDLSTFSFGPISVAGQTLFPPQGTTYSTTVDLRPGNNLLVGVNALLDPNSGIATWKFTSIDPSTGKPTTNPTAGFLPPGANGSVFFTVKPKQSATTGTQVQNQATIVFDANPPMSTSTWLNTIDVTAPISQVQPLPATEGSSSFTVQWQGSDVGSGVQDYTVYVSVNGSAFTPWLTNTTASHGTFTGVAGNSYGFYSIARDLVGNLEAAKTSAEASTTIASAGSTCATDVSSQLTITRGGFRFNHATSSFVQTVTVTNNGQALTGASLVLDSLSSNATLSQPAGTTQCAAPLGSPWLSIPSTLGSGQSVAMTLTFGDPSMAAISYTTRILAGGGQP